MKIKKLARFSMPTNIYKKRTINTKCQMWFMFEQLNVLIVIDVCTKIFKCFYICNPMTHIQLYTYFDGFVSYSYHWHWFFFCLFNCFCLLMVSIFVTFFLTMFSVNMYGKLLLGIFFSNEIEYFIFSSETRHILGSFFFFFWESDNLL